MEQFAWASLGIAGTLIVLRLAGLLETGWALAGSMISALGFAAIALHSLRVKRRLRAANADLATARRSPR